MTDPKIKFNEILHKNIIPNLDLLTAGIKPPDPIYLLSSQTMKNITNQFKEYDYDFILFDTPPSQGLADSKIVSELSDLAIYVVALEDTNKNLFKSSISSFISNVKRAKPGQDVPITVVSNRSKADTYTGNGYGYDYYYKNNLYNYYNTFKKSNSKIQENNSVKEENIIDSKYILFRKAIYKNWKKFINWIDF